MYDINHDDRKIRKTNILVIPRKMQTAEQNAPRLISQKSLSGVKSPAHKQTEGIIPQKV